MSRTARSLRQHMPGTTRELMKRSGLSQKKVHKVLREMKRLGVLERQKRYHVPGVAYTNIWSLREAR